MGVPNANVANSMPGANYPGAQQAMPGNYNPQYAQYYNAAAQGQNYGAAQPYYGNYGAQQPAPNQSQSQPGSDKK